MPAPTTVTLVAMLDGEQIGDPIPGVMRNPNEIAPAEPALLDFPKGGHLVLEARDADGNVITSMEGPVEAGQKLALEPFPPAPKPSDGDVLLTDVQYRLYLENLAYMTDQGTIDPADDEQIERLRLRVANDVVLAADSVLSAMHRQVRGRIHERYRRLELPWDDTLCNLWSDVPGQLCGLTPGHPGGHHPGPA